MPIAHIVCHYFYKKRAFWGKSFVSADLNIKLSVHYSCGCFMHNPEVKARSAAAMPLHLGFKPTYSAEAESLFLQFPVLVLTLAMFLLEHRCMGCFLQVMMHSMYQFCGVILVTFFIKSYPICFYGDIFMRFIFKLVIGE